jgi:hypothetical protein
MDTRQGLTSAQTGSKGLDKRNQADERGDYEWTLESDGITISLGAPGFTQYLRRRRSTAPATPCRSRGAAASASTAGYTPDGRSRILSMGASAKAVSLNWWPMMVASPTMLGRTRHSW